MLVTKLLRNGWTYFYQIFCAYRLGLRIGQQLYFIALNDKGDPALNFFFFVFAKLGMLGQLVSL